MGFDAHPAVEVGGDVHLMTWAGTAINDLLALVVQAAGLECQANDVGVVVIGCRAEELSRMLTSLTEFPSVESLSHFVENLRSAKFDEFIEDPLLRRLWAARNQPVREEAERILGSLFR
jgi:ATP-dependent Lhr-like helicase